MKKGSHFPRIPRVCWREAAPECVNRPDACGSKLAAYRGSRRCPAAVRYPCRLAWIGRCCGSSGLAAGMSVGTVAVREVRLSQELTRVRRIDCASQGDDSVPQ